ncbi:MAG TPA: radical SAM protein [Spirochaetota bacterium]|nr:radical SAM protein [Spirochaetota bacterium]
MKVLLINAPFPFEEAPTPPFGLMSLAGYLLREGIEVIIEDYIIQPYSRERVRRVLREFRPDVVGATAVTMNVKKALSILKDFREEDPGLATVMGGPHVSFDADGILKNNPFVDFIVRGEGEVSFTELLDCLKSGGNPSGVKGVSFRLGGEVVHNKDRPLIPDINILPEPARHLVPLSRYRALGFPISMVTSRGCPYKCIFCVGARMVGRKVRNFEVGRVVDEFEALSQMGFVQINIVDDLFTANQTRCKEICDEIVRRGVVHPWGAFARVDSVSPQLLEKMKTAGCTALCYGIESGDQAILDRIKKKTTLEKCRVAARISREAGIEPMMSFILGLPGETAETARTTMEFARTLSTSYGFHVLSPFPGTEVRDRAAEYGMKVLTDDWDLYDANHAVMDPGSIAPEEVERLANWYVDGITDYIDDLEPRKARGDVLSEADERALRGVRAFRFNRTLILDELIERYPGITNCAQRDTILLDFADYLERLFGYSRDEINDQLQRLINLKCIDLCNDARGSSVCWT